MARYKVERQMVAGQMAGREMMSRPSEARQTFGHRMDGAASGASLRPYRLELIGVCLSIF